VTPDADHVPAKPVKLTSRNPEPYRATVSVPADTLKLIELASAGDGATVVPTKKLRVPVEPEYVALTTGVPVTVRFVDVSVDQTAALLPVTVILPVPKAIVLTPLPLQVKIRHDSVND
jgi:hypothetical protein